MALEHIAVPHPGMEICPLNSRFSMRWNAAERTFYIAEKGSSATLATLPYEEGKYVYALLRGQVRLEEVGRQSSTPGFKRGLSKSDFTMQMTTSGLGISDEQIQKMWQEMTRSMSPVINSAQADPSTTLHEMFKGQHEHTGEGFVHTEDAKVRTGFDITPRAANRSEDCHSTALRFARMHALQPQETMLFLRKGAQLNEIMKEIAAHPLPQLVEIAVRDAQHNIMLGSPADAVFSAHSFLVLAAADGGYICFEKVGTALPWRLAPLSEIYAMYATDFVNANNKRPELFWSVKTLVPAKPKRRKAKKKSVYPKGGSNQ